jgi:mRNA-degrading endonuclease RelE of RelBE toxin-antitoxin system/cytoplasmic iron level regulating protein YaaA (DUF328/UPF0246 family)
LHKKKGGKKEYFEKGAIFPKLKPNTRETLLELRHEAFNILMSGEIRWQGIPTNQLDFNKELARGKDFGGQLDARYLPALDRYEGRFFGALERIGKKRLLDSRHHILFLSGLYGLVTPQEPIQIYSLPLERESKISEVWKNDKALTKILSNYIHRNGIKRVFDFTSRQDYRELIDWELLSETGADFLHCFYRMGGGDDALIQFARLLKASFLEASEEELLSIEPESEINSIVMRDVPETWDYLPKEELEEMHQFEKEIQRFSVSTPISEGRGWLIWLTSEFRRDLSNVDHTALDSRILNAIDEVSIDPMTPRGDTVQPLHKTQGWWRYRLGKYRLVYYTDNRRKIVFLKNIRERKAVYK